MTVGMKMLNQPKIGSRWKHWKDGKTYTVVKFAVLCDTTREIDDGRRLLVIYEDKEGGSFARLQCDWHSLMPGGVRRFTEME